MTNGIVNLFDDVEKALPGEVHGNIQASGDGIRCQKLKFRKDSAPIGLIILSTADALTGL